MTAATNDQKQERFRYVGDAPKANTGSENLSQQQRALLEGCRSFSTLDEHADNLSKKAGLDGAIDVHRELKEFADKGLLVSRTSLIQRLIGGTASGAESGIKYLGVPTRNRPEDLQRCLESFAECAATYGREVTFVVSDQSTPEYAQANLEVLKQISTKVGANISYLDQAELDRVVGEIGDITGVPESVLQFGLKTGDVPTSYAGANRNALLLSAVDELCLQVDDDMLCRVASPPQSEPSLRLGPLASAQEFWFPHEGEPLVNESSLVNEDVFALLERFLGKTASQCIRDSGAPFDTDVDQASPRLVRRVIESDDKVIFSCLGLMGVSGRSVFQSFLLLSGDKRARIIESEEVYRHVQQNHRVLISVTQPTIGDDAFCRGTNMALDNRELLPPFMPFFRGQDILFGRTVSATVNGFFSMIPLMMEHIGAGIRVRTDAKRIAREARTSCFEVMSALLNLSCARLMAVDAKNHGALGRALKDFGSMPIEDLNETLRLQLWPQRAQEIAKMERALARYDHQPRFWSADIEEFVAETRNGLTSENCAVAENFIEAFGRDAAPEMQKRFVYQFGELLEAWPEIRRGAREIKKRRGELGRKI